MAKGTIKVGVTMGFTSQIHYSRVANFSKEIRASNQKVRKFYLKFLWFRSKWSSGCAQTLGAMGGKIIFFFVKKIWKISFFFLKIFQFPKLVPWAKEQWLWHSWSTIGCFSSHQTLAELLVFFKKVKKAHFRLENDFSLLCHYYLPQSPSYRGF